MSIGLEKLGAELAGAGAARDGLRRRIALWEDLLTLVVDPESPRVADRARTRGLLERLLERAGVDAGAFWRLQRGQRGRLFLSRYSRVSRDIPQLEISAFDIDKALKERFRREPLTVGAAWHHGFWRSYFSHAAITHPANDGLREEFSTAWDIVRKHPAVLFRGPQGQTRLALRGLRLDLPMIVGPLPYSDGFTMERAWLEAIALADDAADLHTRSLVVVEADAAAAYAEVLAPHAANLMIRLGAAHGSGNGRAAGIAAGPLADLLRCGRIVELVSGAGLEPAIEQVLTLNPRLLVSVYLRYGPGFWEALERAVSLEAVAMIHVHAGPVKSYHLIPRVDAFLKARLVRARVQLVNAGGDSDAQASAATVYESVLLGANGGAMTHTAGLALLPELVDVYHGADPAPLLAGLEQRDPEALRDLALHTLACWQHSILDFLSCMGIDDIQKTSGNTMAITMTADWIREVDALASPEFGGLNAGLNRRRIAAEPVPAAVCEQYRISALLGQLDPDLPLVHAARAMAHENANWHLENSNRNLSADFLEVIYRMAAGQRPRADDFFIASDMGAMSLDAVGLKLSRASLAWSLERLERDPALLDYISLAVPRGFMRPGAVAAGARLELRVAGAAEPIERFEADARGGFEIALDAGHAIEAALAAAKDLWLVARPRHPGDGAEQRVDLIEQGHGGHGHSVLRASRDGAGTLRRLPRGGFTLSGFGFREPVWHSPVSHASISLGAASEDFLIARIEGNAGISMTSSGEGGPIRLASAEDMKWESLQAASGHFGIHAADLRRVRDVEIKINQGAKPGKGGRLSGAKVTTTVSKARNIPVGTDALSPDPKHDIYSIEDMPAEVWLWLLYHNPCGRTSSWTTCWWTRGSAAPATITPTPRTSAGPTSSAPSSTPTTRWCTKRWTSTARASCARSAT